VVTHAELRNDHVFISYHLSCESRAIDIRDRLKDAGFSVWIDIDDMRQSFTFSLHLQLHHLMQTDRATLPHVHRAVHRAGSRERDQQSTIVVDC